MTAHWTLALGKLTRRIGFRSTLYGLLGVVTALAGAFLKDLIPEGLATRIGADSAGNILGILAASMLTVTTFSLSTMVSAYASASSSATPRATRLLIDDTRAQGALATFIGAFVFSIVGLIALSTGLYGDSGRLVLFGTTIAVIAVITVTLLRAIEQFSRFGRLGETIDLVEQATARALQRRSADPRLGAAAPLPLLPADAVRVFGEQVAYVEHLDIAHLHAVAEASGLRVHLLCQPGTFATAARPLMAVEGTLSPAVRTRLLAGIGLNGARSLDSDPRYGLVVLAEIAQRAMSPAVNDPGTCIDVIGTSVRLLSDWARAPAGAAVDVRFPRVHLAALDVHDMFADAFTPIARDSAGSLEVNVRLQKAFAALAAAGNGHMRAAALRQARDALLRALARLDFADDRSLLLEVARTENGLLPQ